ncbi:hypothetical protein FOA52_000334 [Chlamydomonas sp. UWO 241]|nr:hypothetical protein FOA52_000334 [Chlamydomonas sp. UWO 241]
MARAEANFWQQGWGLIQFLDAARTGLLGLLGVNANVLIWAADEEDEEGSHCLAALMTRAATGGQVDAMRLLLDHPSATPALLMQTTSDGLSPLILAAQGGHVDVMRLLLDHSSADAEAMIMYTNNAGWNALIGAAEEGHVEAMRVLLDHPSADVAEMMMHADGDGWTAFGWAAQGGHVDAMHLLLDHPSADSEALLMRTNDHGLTALMEAAGEGHVEAMRLMLFHLSADAAIMMLPDDQGVTALMEAAMFGRVEAMRLLLDHPSADAAATIALRNSTGDCALTMAAQFAAHHSSPGSWQPLLLLLRRVASEPRPSATQRARMTKMLETLCQSQHFNVRFDSDQPDDIHDECIRLLLAHGACTAQPWCDNPVVSRIIHVQFNTNAAQLTRVAQVLNEAVLGFVFTWQQQ